MKSDLSILNQAERMGLQLCTCYRSFGYSQFKMRKFEEYDLYARNKDFLVSDNVITFNDCNGKLMALKPDVTLSIVRAGKDVPGSVQKVYYLENVYRVTKGSGNFREIQQAGLECIGEVDAYLISEVLMLACRSLQTIRDRSVLYLSHLGIVSALIDALGVSADFRQEILRCIGSKNLHELTALCRKAGADAECAEKLRRLVQLHGAPEAVLCELKTLSCGDAAVQELALLTENLRENGYASQVQIDFSIVSDPAYYNGIVFQGYVDGVPESVLSGGQYDRLMEKMGRTARAIGFAVYLDALERLEEPAEQFDVDLLLLYDGETDCCALCGAVKRLTEQGLRVLAAAGVPEKLQYRQLGKLAGSGVEILEDHA